MSSINISMINLKKVLNIFYNFTIAFIYLFIAKNINFIQQGCTQLNKSDFYKRRKITISNKFIFFLLSIHQMNVSLKTWVMAAEN